MFVVYLTILWFRLNSVLSSQYQCSVHMQTIFEAERFCPYFDQQYKKGEAPSVP